MGQKVKGKTVAFLAAAFCDKAVEEICEGHHEGQARQAKAASAA